MRGEGNVLRVNGRRLRRIVIVTRIKKRNAAKKYKCLNCYAFHDWNFLNEKLKLSEPVPCYGRLTGFFKLGIHPYLDPVSNIVGI